MGGVEIRRSVARLGSKIVRVAIVPSLAINLVATGLLPTLRPTGNVASFRRGGAYALEVWCPLRWAGPSPVRALVWPLKTVEVVVGIPVAPSARAGIARGFRCGLQAHGDDRGDLGRLFDLVRAQQPTQRLVEAHQLVVDPGCVTEERGDVLG